MKRTVLGCLQEHKRYSREGDRVRVRKGNRGEERREEQVRLARKPEISLFIWNITVHGIDACID